MATVAALATAVLGALLCSHVEAQSMPCMGGEVLTMTDDSTGTCVTLGASLIAQGLAQNNMINLTVYSHPPVGSASLSASVSQVMLTDQLLIPSFDSANSYMVYARLPSSKADSVPKIASPTGPSLTVSFWNDAGIFIAVTEGSTDMKSRVALKMSSIISIFQNAALQFRKYDAKCYNGDTSSACDWTALTNTTNDLAHGTYEFYVTSVIAGVPNIIVAYPRIFEVGSPASSASPPSCSSGSGFQVCTCSSNGFAAFNTSLCVPVGRVLRKNGFMTNADITLTYYRAPALVSMGQDPRPRRIFQKTVRITDDLILPEFMTSALGTLIDFNNQDVYSSNGGQTVEALVKNSFTMPSSIATQKVSTDGKYTVTLAGLLMLSTPEYRAFSEACQGANVDATGNCTWAAFGATPRDLAAGKYEFLGNTAGLYSFPPILYTVGPGSGGSGAPATAVLPSIFTLVCVLALAIGVRMD